MGTTAPQIFRESGILEFRKEKYYYSSKADFLELVRGKIQHNSIEEYHLKIVFL